MKINKNTVFTGSGCAIVTPFLDGKIDFAAFDALVEMQIQGGTDAIIVGGTTGEAATLSEDERYALYEHSLKVIGGRCKVIFGTGTNDTRVALEHTRIAASLGADGALVVTPYYNKGTEEGIFRHYSTIAECSNLPIILYNVPTRTGVNLGLNLLSRLSAYENVVGIKEAGDSADRLVSLAELGEALPLYAGNDSQIYTVLSLGGKGVISVVANVLPRAVKKITDSFFMGEQRASLALQLELLSFIKTLFLETNPAPLKFIMEYLGLTRGELRLPLYEVRDSTKTALLDEFKRIEHLV